jgi:hypothetical protein
MLMVLMMSHSSLKLILYSGCCLEGTKRDFDGMNRPVQKTKPALACFKKAVYACIAVMDSPLPPHAWAK